MGGTDAEAAPAAPAIPKTSCVTRLISVQQSSPGRIVRQHEANVARGRCSVDPLRRENPFLLCGPCRDVIHERGREAIIRLQLQLLEPPPNGVHAGRVEAAFDDR
jgi:hypothetical protein